METLSKPDPVVRNGCVFSVNSRDEDRLNKHGSELELHPIFVQGPGAWQERGGKEENWETASIHRRITQDFLDTEDHQQDKSYAEVISNHLYDNHDQNQSGQVMRASINAIIPSSDSAWILIKGWGGMGGKRYFPNPNSLRFNRLTDVRSNIHSPPFSQEFELSHGLKKQGLEIVQANHFLGEWRGGEYSLSLKLANHSRLPFQVKKGQRLGWMSE